MNANDFFSGAYCINLESRKDRWKSSQNEFKKIGISPDRFNAIIDSYPPRGCLKSHIELLEQHQKKGGGNILIFEDDVEFIEDANTIIKEALKEIADIKWDFLYFGGNILKNFYQKTKRLARLTHCQSTHAYSINGDFIDEALSILKNEDNFIDLIYSRKIIPFKKCYIVIPMVAIQREDYSDIEKGIMSYNIPIHRYKEHLITLENQNE